MRVRDIAVMRFLGKDMPMPAGPAQLAGATLDADPDQLPRAAEPRVQ